MTARKAVLSFFWYLTAVIALLVTLVPVVWVAVSSFRPNSTIFKYVIPLSFSSFLPTPFSFTPYVAVFAGGFGHSLFNTFLVTTVTVGVGLIINSMAGLAFAKLSFPGKNVVFVFTVISFMVPFQAIAIPLFILINQLGWMNSYQALIVPALSNGLVVLLFRQFFIGIPDAMADSAKIDGAPWRTIYWRIFMPMSKAAIISGGLMLFLNIWLSFIWPLIANPNPQYEVVQVTIARFSNDHGLLWNQQFAATLITMLIPIVILLFLQRYYVGTVSGSGLKE